MIAFSFFGFPIYWYWIFYFISFLLSYFLLSFINERKILQISRSLYEFLKNKIDDLFIYMILWVLIWWRLGYVLIYNLNYFLQNPLKIFYIWEWWMSFVGWVIWVVLALLFIKAKNSISKKDFLILWDIIISILPLWIFFWRLGNFLNQELYWVNITKYFWYLPWNIALFLKKIWIFHIYDKIDNILRVNSNLFEMIFEWVLLFVILQLCIWNKDYWKRIYPWFVSWLFFLLYWIIRFIAEYLREYPSTEFISIFTKSQILMMFFIIIWIYLIFKFRNESKSLNKK